MYCISMLFERLVNIKTNYCILCFFKVVNNLKSQNLNQKKCFRNIGWWIMIKVVLYRWAPGEVCQVSGSSWIQGWNKFPWRKGAGRIQGRYSCSPSTPTRGNHGRNARIRRFSRKRRGKGLRFRFGLNRTTTVKNYENTQKNV